jgi:LacI family repressor for deo operon, udp, cdd, tsx, nupC, and nupG
MARRDNARTKTTISDVALHVGVATSTVSRALMQPGRVSDEMRLRVEAAAKELGYVPNPQARSLTSGRTLNLALFIPDITNPSFFDLIRGAQAEASARGYRLLLVDTEASASAEARAFADLSTSVDGVIAPASRLSDEQLHDIGQRIPLVVINREVEGLQSVLIDTASGMVHALEHLVSLGHRHVAYLSGPDRSWSNQRRWDALQSASLRLGVECVKLGPFSPTLHSGAAAADSAVNAGTTACLFFNDLIAIGALGRFAERGLRVPEQMSVVGCDDIFGADFCNPPLTTIAAPFEQAARIATERLITALQYGEPISQEIEPLPSYLKIRQSTGPVSSA